MPRETGNSTLFNLLKSTSKQQEVQDKRTNQNAGVKNVQDYSYIRLLTDLLYIFQSIKELERIGQVSEFNSQDSLDVERSFQIVENENEENTAPPALPAASGIPDVESREKPIEKVKGKKVKKREKFKSESPSKDDDEISEEYLDKQIPRNKKAMKIKLKNILIELHRMKILDRERERHCERIEEKEEVIKGREFVIQSLDEKLQLITQRIEEKTSELREKERLLREVNGNVELCKKQLAEPEDRADLDTRVELESLRRENERLKQLLQIQEKNNNLRERELEICSLKQEKETLQEEKRESDKISLERKFSVGRLNREEERGLAYLGQLEVRLTEKEQALRQASDERAELRDQLRRKEALLLEKDRTLETLENSRKGTTDRLDRLERQWQDERRAQRSAYDTLRDEKRVCEERLQRAEADAESYQRRIRALEHQTERARQTTDVFRGDQPWMISKDEIKLSDKVLGTGAWGRVVEGNFRGTKVAVKEIHEIIQSAHNRLLFDREITFATLVRHPCILQFLAVAEYRTSKPLLVAELMDMSLSQLVRDEKTLGNRFIRILALDVAYGLNYLHGFRPNPILHRDVNSGNVMVWRQGDKWRGKLCDFGSAEFMGSKMSENPGNPFYSAPEASSSCQTPKVGHSYLYLFSIYHTGE